MPQIYRLLKSVAIVMTNGKSELVECIVDIFEKQSSMNKTNRHFG